MIDLERKGILDYIDEAISDAKNERVVINDINCYAAGYSDAVIDEFKRLRDYITGE